MIESIVPEIDAALRMIVVEARLATNRTAHASASGAIARVLFPASSEQRAGHAASTVQLPDAEQHWT